VSVELVYVIKLLLDFYKVKGEVTSVTSS